MTPDAYEKGVGFVRTLKHFDNFTKENQLVPYRSNENGDSNSATFMIGAFEFANGQLYGLSYASGNVQHLYFKTDYTNATWDGSLANTVVNAAYQGIIRDYHGALYMSRSTTFDAYTYAASRLDTNISALSVQFTDAVVHSKDDTLYLASGNKIYANSSAVGANPPTASLALTLAVDYTIASMCEYGDYLALLLTPNTLGKKAYIYLWSRSTTSRDGDTSIEIGNVQGLLIENVGGELIIVAQKASANALIYAVSFYSYSGGVPQLFAKFDSTTLLLFGVGKQKINNRMYFPMALTWNGNYLSGIWQVSRTQAGQPFEITLDHIISDSAITSAGNDALEGFIQVGDYMFISYQTGGVYAMTKTDDQANYTLTSVLESVANPDMPLADYFATTKLMAVGIYSAPLTSGQQLVLKVRVDSTSNSDFKTVLTKTSVTPDTKLTGYETQITPAMNIPDGVNIEFRIESTGGAIPTAWGYKYDVIPSNV